MKIKYLGPIDIDDLFQALYQDRNFIFGEHKIERVRSATLYFTPCNAAGEVVKITDARGRPIEGCISAGAYFSSAAEYDRRVSIDTKIIGKPPALTP